MSLFKPRVASTKVRQLKELVRDAWALPEEVAISVMEVECMEVNCPDMETNIILMSDGSESRLFKIYKSLAEVTPDDLLGLREVP